VKGKRERLLIWLHQHHVEGCQLQRGPKRGTLRCRQGTTLTGRARQSATDAQRSCGAPQDADRRALLRVISSPSIAKLGLVEFEFGLLADDISNSADEAPKRWLRWRLGRDYVPEADASRSSRVVLLAPRSAMRARFRLCASCGQRAFLRFAPLHVCAYSVSILSIAPVSTRFLSRSVRPHLVDVPRPAHTTRIAELVLVDTRSPRFPVCPFLLTHARARAQGASRNRPQRQLLGGIRPLTRSPASTRRGRAISSTPSASCSGLRT
jgi:hypothetical protein